MNEAMGRLEDITLDMRLLQVGGWLGTDQQSGLKPFIARANYCLCGFIHASSFSNIPVEIHA